MNTIFNKVHVVVLLALFLVSACKKNDEGNTSNRLKNCDVQYLYFKDEIQNSSYQTLNFIAPPGSTTPLKCSYQYNDQGLNRITGGFFPVPQGTNLTSFVFTETAYDSIIQNAKTHAVYTKFVDAAGLTHEYLSNPTVFYQLADNRLERITQNDGFFPGTKGLRYSYEPDLIVEFYNDTMVNRKFFFENGNLIKILTERTKPSGTIYWKKEILFTAYDNNPNPFKDRFYIKGAFFRAFSANNYRDMTIKEYSLGSDSTLQVYVTSTQSFSFGYNSQGYPLFGEYE